MSKTSQVDVVRRNLVTHNLVAAVSFRVTVIEAMGDRPIELTKDKLRIGPLIGCFDCEQPLDVCKTDPCRGEPQQGLPRHNGGA